MPQISKKLILPMAAVAVVGAGLFGASLVSADSSSTDPQGSLVQKLADTFHVDKSKVQAVFDEHHTQMQADREAKYEDRLAQAVKDGQLTEDQKSKLLAKHKELVSQMEANKGSMKDKTPAERRTAMESERTAVQQWAKDNGVDAKWLMPLGGRGHGFGHGGPGAPGADDAPAPSASPSS
jgi:hypothetical protein